MPAEVEQASPPSTGGKRSQTQVLLVLNQENLCEGEEQQQEEVVEVERKEEQEEGDEKVTTAFTHLSTGPPSAGRFSYGPPW